MKKHHFLLTFLLFSGLAGVFGQANDMQDNIALIKLNLAASKESIKKYQWIETTTAYVDGEQKSVKQYQCYYDVTGKLTKVETGGTTPPAKTPPGIRGKIAENKIKEMDDYIEKAVAQVKTYIPPQAEKLQQIYAAGSVSIQVLVPGQQFKLGFPNYLLPGDLLSISVNKTNKVLTGYSVNTYVTGPTDTVSLDITFNTLPDGTQYPGTATFNSTSKSLKIVIQNTGFQATAGH
jgi:hypothetical protein